MEKKKKMNAPSLSFRASGGNEAGELRIDRNHATLSSIEVISLDGHRGRSGISTLSLNDPDNTYETLGLGIGRISFSLEENYFW